MADDQASPVAEGTVEHATCLGCGCACDDITVVVGGGRIVETRQTCPLGVTWFGDGTVPDRIRLPAAANTPAAGPPDLATAVQSIAAMLAQARHPLIYLAADVTCEAQGAATALADYLAGSLDTVTSSTAAAGIMAAQRRGRVSATLGEVRNRADVVVFWGVDPDARYPRYTTRYAPDPVGLMNGGGRDHRTVIAVDIGGSPSVSHADERVAFAADEELDALALLQVALAGRLPPDEPPASIAGRAGALAARLRQASYLAIVTDGEPLPERDPRRSEAMLLLADALNGPTRCVVSTLRAGGNRSGADAVATWQTGFPMAVHFAGGRPAYDPRRDAAALCSAGEIDVALIVGSPTSLPEPVRTGLAQRSVRCIAVGPRASESPLPVAIAVDTGVAGIHERGTAVRMDDIPLPLRPSLTHPRDAVTVLRMLAAALIARGQAASPGISPSLASPDTGATAARTR